MAAFDKYEIKDLFKDTGVLPPSKFMNLIDGLWRPNLWLYNEQLLSENDLEKVNPEDENYDARYLYEPNSFLTAGDEDIYSWSQAYGYGHVVRANFAQVFGHANQANGMFETVMGSYATKSEAQTAKEWVVTDRLWTLGNGYDDDNRSDALTIYKSGFGVWDNAIAIGLYSHGGAEPIDGSIQFLLDSSEGYLQVYYNSQWNNLTIGSHTAVEKFIELSDCPTNYADRYALISDAENSQIIYSTVHGAAPKWFFVDQGCPNPSWDPEILINGDFAAGDTGWTVPAGWSTATGAAVHTAGNTGALTQEVEGFTLSGTYKLEVVTSGITAGTITITVHDAATDAQLGETYIIGASNQGAGLCLFELVARDNYLIKITPSTTFDGTVDDCSFKKGDLNSSVPQIRGYTFNHTNVSPFEVAWRNSDLYIGRDAGWRGGLGVGGVVAVTPDGMTTVTGGYNITALGHTVGNGITNEHDLILIGTEVTVDTEQNNWLKIGIGSNAILEGDLSTLDLYARGDLEVNRNLTLWSGNTYDYTFPEPITLNIGRFMYVSKATPAGELNWSVYSFPTSLPGTSSVPLISEAGVGTWLANSSIAKWGTLTSGYVPYFNGSELVDSNMTYNTVISEVDFLGNVGLTNTTNANKFGIIYKNANPFIHNFNYGNNGTVTTAGGNLFIGENAGNLTMGSNATQTYHSSNNVFTGYLAGRSNTTGYYNVFTGNQAGRSNTTGYYNVFTGNLAGYANTTGYSNVFTGFRAGRYLADGATANDISNTSVFIGNDTRALSAGNNNQIVIGASAIGKGSNTVVLGNTSIVGTYLTGVILTAGSIAVAPLAFTSGTLTTGAAIKAGQMEFLTDRFYGTITTGAARKQFAFLEDNLNLFSSGTATSGHVPQANGSGGVVWGTVTTLPSGTNGDILYYNSGWQVLAKGTEGNFLKQGSSIPEWAEAASGSKWTQGTYGIHYAGGNVGIGMAAVSTSVLQVDTQIDDYIQSTLRVQNNNSDQINNRFAIIASGHGHALRADSSAGYGIWANGADYHGYFAGPSGNGIYVDKLTIRTLVFPTTDGLTDQVLKTDGSGTLGWATVTGSQWVTDGNGITYENNVGIGAASNASFKLYVLADVAAYAMKIINASGGGLQSVSNAATGYMYGLWGETNSDDGSAVYGNAKGDAIGVSGVSAGGTGVYGSGVSWGGHFKGGVRIETGGLTFGSKEVIASTRIANLVSLKIGGTERISSAGVFTPSNGVSGSWTTVDGKTITATNGIITSIV